MNYLQITQYGNTIQEWLISLATLVSSVIIARYGYHALRKTVFEWLNQTRIVLDKDTLTRACALTTYLIPMVGFALAHNRLLFDKELTNWLNIGLLIVGQITFLLILITVIELLVETLPIKYMKSVRHDDRKFLQAQKEAIEKIRKRIKVLGGALLILVPALTVLTYMARVSAALWAVPGMIVLIKMMHCVRIVRVAKRKFRKPEITTIKFETALEPEPAQIGNDQDIKIKETVVEFFLDIFKYQGKLAVVCNKGNFSGIK